MRSVLVVADEVRHALTAGAPVVAFESTVITHGLPYPTNLELALRMEELARSAGCVPATIGVIDGVIHVGMTRAELEQLASLADADVVAASGPPVKASSFDLPFVAATGKSAGTTVSGTLYVCDLVDINVFATGGIGGVHRGVGETFDISHDLPSIASSRAITVCAGAKAILDLPKTLEYLETAGVCVIGFGTRRFPAFYSRDSGLDLDHWVEGPDAPNVIARAFSIRNEFRAMLSAQLATPDPTQPANVTGAAGYGGGMLVVAPVPAEHEIPAAEIEGAIQRAVADAAAAGVHGKGITPFILEQMNRITEGRSVRANRALLENNARVAAEIAVAISRCADPHGRLRKKEDVFFI